MSNRCADASTTTVREALENSSGEAGWASLSPAMRVWLGGLSAQLPPDFLIYNDGPASKLAQKLGAAGFAFENRIVLGDVQPEQREAVLRHELVHLAQFGLADSGVDASGTDDIEAEARELAALPIARPARHAANSSSAPMLFWFLLLGTAGVGVAAPTTPANAPTADGATLHLLPLVSAPEKMPSSM